LDSQVGLICQHTGKIADFHDKCDDFEKDLNLQEKVPLKESPVLSSTPTDLIDMLPQDIRRKL
jgi:hypothetical protein